MGYILGIVSCFGFIWFIIGCVWLFGDDDCEDDWEDGYIATLVFLILYFIGFGCALCAVLVVLILLCVKGKESLAFLRKGKHELD
mmetsp:Transcript_7113/g.903  ORF Transcript_7113/g.903 Transcript_7113/m.903 type:complete len:85 (+) Transcript_7113:243-497(+)